MSLLAALVPQATVFQEREAAQTRLWIGSGQAQTQAQGEERIPFDAIVLLPPVSSVDGVQLSSLSATARLDYELRVSAEGVALDGSELSLMATYDSYVYGCDPGLCIVGSDSPHMIASATASTSIAPGETRLVSVAQTFGGLGGSGTRQALLNYGWLFLEGYPGYSLQGQLEGEWSCTNSVTGEPEPVSVLAFPLEVTTDIHISGVYELLPAGSSTYCTSQANGTGVTARMNSYGSLDAGSEFFSMVADGVPAGSVGILFAGTAPANTPGATATVCVGGQVQRVGGVQVEAGGRLQFDLDLIGRSQGDLIYFQAFHRDPVLDVAATEASFVVVR